MWPLITWTKQWDATTITALQCKTVFSVVKCRIKSIVYLKEVNLHHIYTFTMVIVTSVMKMCIIHELPVAKWQWEGSNSGYSCIFAISAGFLTFPMSCCHYVRPRGILMGSILAVTLPSGAKKDVTFSDSSLRWTPKWDFSRYCGMDKQPPCL